MSEKIKKYFAIDLIFAIFILGGVKNHFQTTKLMRKYQELKEILRPSSFHDYVVALIIVICLLVVWIFIVLPRVFIRH